MPRLSARPSRIATDIVIGSFGKLGVSGVGGVLNQTTGDQSIGSLRWIFSSSSARRPSFPSSVWAWSSNSL